MSAPSDGLCARPTRTLVELQAEHRCLPWPVPAKAMNTVVSCSLQDMLSMSVSHGRTADSSLHHGLDLRTRHHFALPGRLLDTALTCSVGSFCL